METNRIVTGDALDVLADLPDDSVHAVVTDPPYGLAFMGKSWDDFEPKEYQEWCEEWAGLCLDVLKPGGHLLAFSGNRTHHRLFTGVEDAGFELRDTVTWHYGSGFPKAGDISKTIDKRADAEREVVATREADDIQGGEYRNEHGDTTEYEYTVAATDEAKAWEGWKTGLKPATEFVAVSRKPFEGATVDCVLNHGTGAMNIDGCRIPSTDGPRTANPNWGSSNVYAQDEWTQDKATGRNDPEATTTEGRYPANVVFDETAARDLDEQTEDTVSTGGVPDGDEKSRHDWTPGLCGSEGGFGDEGGVSRYFYTSKATKAERTLNGQIENSHPTVKPQDLMEWLVNLVTREGQVVLDPFAGTGTTCSASKALAREFVGVERQARWADVARARCGLTVKDYANIRTDDGQLSVADF